ncbi:hypothetical protein PRIPAC_85564 [Pristionchus pacificus]|uniref:Uncharacterized protein n=1 Tax=Pristionchus pacificus TaxID=54126 RepID=A0A454Y2E6_PRIPA|nr:hypothetical protein PRIPAC_85564 [Pristionchus pacificus]|eukprot:PDM66591.1 hypothetical protein PRIPAC_48008 [Pristionchus pacificus]
MARYENIVTEYRKKSDAFKHCLNALEETMRHSMTARQRKMKNNWPLNGLEMGNRIVMKQFEEYTELLKKINEEVEDENLFEEIMDEHLIVKGEIECLQEVMAQHANQLGRNREFEFINLDFLEDPSNGDFDWRTEETIEFLMISEFNMERRRHRRVKEGNNFEKVEFAKGFIPENCAEIIREFENLKRELVDKKRILMKLHSVNDNNAIESSEKLMSEALSSLNDIFRFVVNATQLYRKAKRIGNNNKVFTSTINSLLLEIDFIFERIHKIVDRCIDQAPFTTRTLRSFTVLFSPINGFRLKHL